MESRLYEKYRPKTLDDIKGKPNQQIIKSLKNYIEKNSLPHAIFFKGETGSGKTTLARILALAIHGGKEENLEWGLIEENMSDKTGVDNIREIGETSRTSSMVGKRVIILDEAHRISSQGQDALLKYFEDIPNHLYWIICTDSHEKLDKALVGRCQEFNLKSLSKDEIISLLREIAKKEKAEYLTDEILEYIAQVSHNNRKAIQNLELAISLDMPSLSEVKLTIKDDDNEDNNLIREIANLILWPFMNKEVRVYDNTYYLPKIQQFLDKDGAIAVALVLSGYCRNRLLGAKFATKADGTLKSLDQATKEFQKLTIMLKFMSKTNYAHCMKPENNFTVDFIEMMLALERHEYGK